MSDMMSNKIHDDLLASVSGGTEQETETIMVRPIKKTCVRVTSPSLHCRYSPDGPTAKDFEYGHILYVDGITSDGLWYRLLINDPKGGTCDGYIYKQNTEVVE